MSRAGDGVGDGVKPRAPHRPETTPDFSVAPMVVFWETTRACALRCLHCRAEAQPRRHPLELTTDEGFRLLDELASLKPAPIVILTGGDPFLRRDIFDLAAYGVNQGLRVSLSPSVTRLVNRRLLAKVRALGISRISFSLDGATSRVHDSFRGVRGSFDQTLARIRDALDVGLSLQVHTTVSRRTIGELPAIPELLATFPGIVLWNLFFLVPTGRGQRDDVLSSEEHERVYHWISDLESTLPFGVKTTLGQAHRRVLVQLAVRSGASPDAALAKVGRAATNDGRGVCFVSHVGEVYPSGFLPLARGNVRRRSVLDIYRDDAVFLALRDPGRLKGKCGMCEFRMVCGGTRARAYAFTGDYLAADPSCAYQPQAESSEPHLSDTGQARDLAAKGRALRDGNGAGAVRPGSSGTTAGDGEIAPLEVVR